MHSEYPNLYKRARQATFLSQEQAAEALGLSSESLKLYESGRRVPSDETVAKMCEVYDIPWLALEHAEATDVLGVLPEVEVKPLPMATLTLANQLTGAAEQLGELMRIAEDGRIDESERVAFDGIVQHLMDIIASAYQVIFAEGEKKERPDAPTSKRSLSQAIRPENDCRNSIAHARGKRKPLFAKGVYAR